MLFHSCGNGVLDLDLWVNRGGESIHSQFNNLERIYGNTPNMVGKLHRIVQEHHLRVVPSNIAVQPRVKRRKKLDE